MEWFEINRAAMEVRYSEILESLKEKMDGGETIETITTRDGNHALVVEQNGKKIRLNSAYRPLEEAKKWAEQYEFQNIGVNIFMFGFGNGYFVRELLHRAASDAQVFVWEPDIEIFRYVMKKEKIVDIFSDKRFSFYVGKSGLMDMKEGVSGVLGWHNISTQVRCSHIGYEKLYREAYHQFFDVLDYIDGVVRLKRDTNAWFSHTAVVNVLKNIKYIRHSNYLPDFIGKIEEDIPAIVVAAGPSLDKNIELLKEAKGKSFIIATDTAIQFLEKRGMPYDCIVTVDPRKPKQYFTNYPGCKDKALFCVTQAQPEVMSFHTGRKIWNAGSVYLEGLYLRMGWGMLPYDSGGSVATAGMEIARQIGLKNIILIGQDLAYSGNRTHAGTLENHILNENLSIKYIDGIDGEKVKTRHDWKAYLDWMEDFIVKYEDINLIDATEGGALIHGSEVLTFQEAIEKYCSGKRFMFEEFMEQFPETFEVMDFSPYEKEIRGIGRGFQNILRKSKEGKKLAEDFLLAGRRSSAKKHDQILKELHKVNNYVSRQSGYELLETYTCDLAKGDMQNINKVTGDAYEDERSTVMIAKSLYEGLINAVIELENKVETAMKEV